MKKQGRIILGTALISAMLWGCTKTDGVLDNATLKTAINQSATNLNNAMDNISTSKAYSILTVSAGTMMKSSSTIQKSSIATDSIYRVYIPLIQ